MIERFFQLDEDSSLDESFRLRYGKNYQKMLNPCEEIWDSSITIGLVDNNNINPKRLLLTGADYNKILVTIPNTGELVIITQPGKSGVVFLNKDVNRGKFRAVTSRILGGGVDRRDHLHLASIGDIARVGWKVYWAPLQMSGNMLHARLVSPNSQNGGDILEEEASLLAQVFKKNC